MDPPVDVEVEEPNDGAAIAEMMLNEQRDRERERERDAEARPLPEAEPKVPKIKLDDFFSMNPTELQERRLGERMTIRVSDIVV